MPSQLTMSSCTCTFGLRKPNYTTGLHILRKSPHGLRTEAERALCDIRAISFHGCRDSPGGRLLVNRVPMREQRTAKLTLNSVFDILKLIPLDSPFTLSSQKVTLSNAVKVPLHTWAIFGQFRHVFHTLSQQN